MSDPTHTELAAPDAARDAKHDAQPDVEHAPSFTEQEPGRKGEILDAALDVFAERGYSGGSMREIASRVGVSEPALYRHFSGKEALFLSLIKLGAGRLRNEAFALIDALQPETLREQLLGVFDDRRRALKLYSPLLRTMLPTVARDPAFLEAFRDTIVRPVFTRISEKAVELDVAFQVPDAEATREHRVRALFSLLIGTFMSSMMLGDKPDEAVTEAALELMGWV